ncbi:hypothetical protein Clacol_008125 [Clathrus columnatus]|uniref:SPRY-domain-containing protein n=1 Tax=Clathrus columnatus TaxID=1419009 RepID=A0AAV5AL99_9AGAM|nr:hypothetical protein Clacol_008125 [Clathrus columnatus]
MAGIGRPGPLSSSSTSSSLSSHGSTTRIDDLLNITVNMHPPRRNPRASLDQSQIPLSINTTTSRRASFNSSNGSNSIFVPRVVRGTPFLPSSSAPSGSSVLTFPPSNVGTTGTTPVLPASSTRNPSLSPTRSRRPPSSSTNTQHSSNVSHRTVSAPIPYQTPIIIPPPSLHATSFPRPSYLEHSAFRHILLSEPELVISPPPEPYRLQPLHASAAATKLRRPTSSETNISDEDSNSERGESTARSAGGRGRASTPSVPRKPAVDAFMRLPTRWSDGDDRYPSLSVSVDGRDLTFHGSMLSGDKDAAAARTNCCIPPACGVYYYEIKILNKGQKGHIGIGFGVRTVKLSKLPGLDKKSWGYHGEDGFSFASEGEGSVYGPKFTTGDVVGCGIDFSTGQAFFTNNGRLIGPVFNNLTSAGELYPTVGLRTPNESIRANFGQEPFMFDIESHVEQIRNQMWEHVMRYRIGIKAIGGASFFIRQEEKAANGKEEKKDGKKIATDEESQGEYIEAPMHDLIMGYLSHQGYSRTAHAMKQQFEKRSKRSTPENGASEDPMDKDGALQLKEEEKELVEMVIDSESTVPKGFDMNMDETPHHLSESAIRQNIIRSITCGKIDAALAQTRKFYPDVLELDGGMILFKLRCRQFVELVLEAARVSKKTVQTQQKGKEREVQVQVVDQDGMDVDDDRTNIPDAEMLSNGNSVETDDAVSTLNGTNGTSSKPLNGATIPSLSTPITASQALLQTALTLGQALQADYKGDPRPEVQNIYKRTLGLVAYEDPFGDDEGGSEIDPSLTIREGGGLASENGSGTTVNLALRVGGKRKQAIPEAIREMASPSARGKLSEEVNKAILESQGRPPHPALERLYRHTQACVVQLAWLGVGAAAFADMPKEFLEN